MVDVPPAAEASLAAKAASAAEASPTTGSSPPVEASPAVEANATAPSPVEASVAAPPAVEAAGGSATAVEAAAAAPPAVEASVAAPLPLEAAAAAPPAVEASVTAPPPVEAVVAAPAADEAPSRAEAAPPAEGARAASPAAAVDAPSGRMRVMLNFDAAGPGELTPPAHSVDAAPHSGRGFDDEHQAFFARADEAAAREREAVLELLREEEKQKALPSPAQIARRQSGRRVLTYVMGGAVVLFGLGSVRFALRDRGAGRAASFRPETVAAPVELSPPVMPTTSVATARAVDSALPAPPPRSPEAQRAQELARQADSSLGGRRYREAIEYASRAVELDPADASAYVIWAKALNETGQRGEAKRVYASCLERATEGPKDECGPGIR
ncbi:MAG TPA: bacterial transcriptional activator domain-containing protein [Polyangiaceae bacterium]|nr:bacterial transcriptional activator domain-containing protein [Polyangiaceae bacterium]